MTDTAGRACDQADFDILGLGAVSVDDLLYVEAYPPADTKVQVLKHQRFVGGMTAIALITAARLGYQTAYAGTLGKDEGSHYVASILRQEGVNLDHVVWHPEAGPIPSTIVIDQTRSTRNIFFQLDRFCGAHPHLPDAPVIQRARVLLVDHVGIEGMLHAARIAHEMQIPIISDLEFATSPAAHELLALVDHLIISRDFAAVLTGDSQPADAAQKLWTPERKVVVVTCGAEGAWYTADGHTAQHQPAFIVNTVDTTGCGDVFHGAYAACLARGVDVAERIRFASAAAALKAMQGAGHQSTPTRAAVEAFLGQPVLF